MKSFKQYINIESLTEANHDQLTFYDDNAKVSDDLKPKLTPENVHKYVRRHLTNMYVLQHIQKHLGDDKPNTKIHYTHQMSIARRKRDYWINHKDNLYDKSKALEDTTLARHAAHSMLKGLGYTDLQEPPKIKQDPKVAALHRTTDGRIQFGVTKK